MRTLIDKINAFENSYEQNVERFNEIFTECPLTECKASDEVEIGEIATPDTTRIVYVNGKGRRHDFKPKLMDFDSFENGTNPAQVGEKTKKYAPMKDLSTMPTNSSTDNSEMSQDDMKLKPTVYKLLQYFRGCPSPYHTMEEIALRVNISHRSIKDLLPEMKSKGIITMNKVSGTQNRRIIIEVTEKWC